MRQAAAALSAASGDGAALPNGRRREVLKRCVGIWRTSCGNKTRWHYGFSPGAALSLSPVVSVVVAGDQERAGRW